MRASRGGYNGVQWQEYDSCGNFAAHNAPTGLTCFFGPIPHAEARG